MLACRQRMQAVAVLAAGLLALWGWAACGVDVSVLSAPKEGSPGTFITHVFGVVNDTVEPATYDLDIAAPQGWGILGAPTSIALQPEEEGTLFVTVTIPPGAAAGSYEVSFTATSQADSDDHATQAAAITVTPSTELELLAPTGASVAPGDAITYEFVLINRGNVQETLNIEATSSSGLLVSVSHAAADLAPQERVSFMVRLDAPIGADAARDILTVTAASTIHEAVETDAVVFTTILPPSPDAVVGTVMEQLPARFRLSLDKNVITGAFDSQLTFSTSGQILGGYFSSFFSLLDPLGPSAAEVSSFSLLYRREPTTFAVGSVSQKLTDLLRLSCTGGSLVLDGEYYDLTLIGGGSAGETRFAGALTLGPDTANVGFGYLGIRDPVAVSETVWSATAHAEPLEDWTMSLEGALGLDGPLTSRALYFNTTLDHSGYFFSGSAFSVGTYFPGQRADSAGIEVSQRLRLDALSLSASLSHVWDNVVRDPLQPTLIEDDLGFNLTATPLEDGPTLTTTLEFSWHRYADPTVKDDVMSLLSASLNETDGVFPYSISAQTLEQIDRVLGTHVRTTTYEEGVGLSVDSFDISLQLSQERSVDILTDTELSASSDVSVRFRPESALHEASIALRNEGDNFDLSASFFIACTEDLDVTFDGSIAWDRADASSVSFGWGVSFNADVTLPLPFFVTKGRIEGRAFIDRDGDGWYSINDEPAKMIVVSAGGVKVSTDEDGYFRFPPRYPATVDVTAEDLPASAAAPGSTRSITVVAGETVWVEIPLTPITVVSGSVFDDIDQDGTRDEDEGGFAQVRVTAVSEERSYDAYTDLAGAFTIADLLPGTYVVELDEATLPDRFEFTTPQTATLVVSAEAPAPVTFGGFIREREVIITFQPPTADFFYEPEAPIAGQPVTFDGSYSFDFDGEIVSYAWDLDADGTIDATDAVLEWSFPSTGSYEISLTVTDDAGNEDTVTYTIDVAPAESSPSTALPPVAEFQFSPVAPTVGQPVQLDASGSSDPDGTIIAYAWDLDGDGAADLAGRRVEFIFSAAGAFVVALTVADDAGNSDTVALTITVMEPAAGPSPSSIQLPIAEFQIVPSAPAAGEPVSFNGTASLDLDGQIVSFAWDFNGDGIVDSTAPIADHVFAEPGTFAVTLTVTDDGGNSDAITKSVSVSGTAIPAGESPIAEFAFMPPTPDAGALVLFNATLSKETDGRIVSYAWDFDGDGSVDSYAAIVDHTFAENGTYDITLAVTDEYGRMSTQTQTLVVGPDSQPSEAEQILPPIADFEFTPQQPQTGSLVRFNGTLSEDTDGTIVSYGWDFESDGTIDVEAAIVEHAFPAGRVDVSLTVTDDDGATDTLTRTLDVLPASPPGSTMPPAADFEFSPELPVAGQLVSFNGLLSADADGEIVAYAWDFDGDGTVDATDAFAQHTFPSSGTYDVSLTVTDDGGNLDTFIQAIFVNVDDTPGSPPPSSFQPPVADFSYMPVEPLAGELVLFNASFSWDFDGEIVAYAWDFDADGTVDATTVSAEHIFPEPGTFFVALTVTDDSGASDTLTLTIPVD